MELKHFVYEFKGINKPIILNSASKIVVVINGVRSFKIEKLFFAKYELDIEDVSGFSILQLVENGKLKIDENTILDISFYDFTTDTEFIISKIRRPFMYDNDKTITTEDRVKMVDLLLPVISPFLPIINNPVVTLGGEHWENFRNKIISEGFNEIAKGNYRFYHLNDQIAFFVLIPGNFLSIELFDEGNGILSFKNEEKDYELIFKNNNLNIKQVVL